VLQTRDPDRPAILDCKKRKRLTSLASAVNAGIAHERVAELSGRVVEVDFENGTFRLRLDGESTIDVPMDETHHDQIRQSAGRSRDQVSVKCMATYDVLERIQKVTAVESLCAIKNHAVAKQFDELRELKNGYCGGLGVAPDKAGLEAAAKVLVDSYPEHASLPTITPTLDGNLLLEWSGGGAWTNLDIGDMKAEFCVFGPDEECASSCFDLNQDVGVRNFFELLAGQVPRDADVDDPHEAHDEAPSLYAVAAGRLADLETGRSASRPFDAVMRDYGLAH
jgi:hypothetical protein